MAAGYEDFKISSDTSMGDFGSMMMKEKGGATKKK